jgi:hypothetical protein
MRKARVFVAAFVAMLSIVAVAAAQTNQYTVTGKVSPAKGGSKAKPKAGSLNFNFQTSEAAGLLPSPIATYSIGFEGGQVNTDLLPFCTAASMTAAKTNTGCAAKSKIGSGVVKSKVGTAGQPVATAVDCQLGLTLYNAGKNKAALWLEGGNAANPCIAQIAQAIDAKFKKKGSTTSLEFTVPMQLRHQLGLDIAVTDVTSKINRIVVTKKGKKRGYLEGIGCKDGKRDITVTFTDETGKATPVKQTLKSC